MAMKKAQYEQRGPVPQDVIQAVEFQTPPLAAGQVLIEVLASPINPSDVLTLTGEYGLLPPLPAVGGNEGVGRIAEVGPEVTNLKPGQTVLLPIQGGTWATHMVAPAKHLIALPDGADPKQLAMITINPPTALLMLSDIVELQPGDWVIQNAANSAVGTYLIQLAKLRGLRTINVVRRESAVEAVRAAGADVVLVDGEDLGKRAREAAQKAPIKLGIDAVGGLATQHIAQSLAEGGVVVNYGAMSGEACQISPASFVFRDVSLRGFWLSRWFQTAAPARRADVFGEITKLIATGKLQARVQATYGLDQIKEAVIAAAAGERDGKILVLPNGPV
ncbi:zinc-dependent alcohol dehydrogenase family protein [Lysobacter sp. ISL-42]|nr:zinc-dependent alcohol dehydrogenase family protein [Lysobacter sp. ISL-42]MBT2750480.1 zinc-dependent alcohol dehydrogenase family protein [Lysobacter sp. ISL-50]MBT2776326.1 zinc-dependent alcohol dehydrogenase family protein [Lysobacter sp. ISL-54]MBT2780821.1 zinc-dependent alcohol dehydrogenase family protein [Lysobacter sp. ISL-52]